MAHPSRKNSAHCPQERRKVAWSVPQAGMGSAKSESETWGKQEVWEEEKPHTAATAVLQESVPHHAHHWEKETLPLRMSGTKCLYGAT